MPGEHGGHSNSGDSSNPLVWAAVIPAVAIAIVFFMFGFSEDSSSSSRFSETGPVAQAPAVTVRLPAGNASGPAAQVEQAAVRHWTVTPPEPEERIVPAQTTGDAGCSTPVRGVPGFAGCPHSDRGRSAFRIESRIDGEQAWTEVPRGMQRDADEVRYCGIIDLPQNVTVRFVPYDTPRC